MKAIARTATFLSLLILASKAMAQPPGVTMEMINTTLPLEEAIEVQYGPYPATMLEVHSTYDFIYFFPSYLEDFSEDNAMPVMVWGNGGCSIDGERTAEFLAFIATHGFLVITTARTANGDTTQTADHLITALDWAEQENKREGSSLYGKIDLENIAAAGQSCGGLLALGVGTDPRVDTIAILNAGAQEAPPGAPAPTDGRGTLEDLAKLHGPVLFMNGHERDFMMEASRDNFDRIDHVPAFYAARQDAGHLATMNHPGGGEFSLVLTGWLLYHLKNDENAAVLVVGEDCALCVNPKWDTDAKGFE